MNLPEGSPQWSQPPGQASGRDHLGMQAPSISLYAALVPNITNMTKRVRYYSFYPWLCEQYARKNGQTSEKEWRRFVRRAEALLALSSSAHADGWQAGVAGIDWAERFWRKDPSAFDLEYSVHADPGAASSYLASASGALGQIYIGALIGLGILTSVPAHKLPVPGLKSGDSLAGAFAASVGCVGDEFIELISKDIVDRDTLRKLGNAMCPSAIPPESVEREGLESVLFDYDAGSDICGKGSRRETLLLCLLASQALCRVPKPEDFRWMLYARHLLDGTPFHVPTSLEDQADRWQAFQANELAHIALESFLALLVETIPTTPIPVNSAIMGVVHKVFEEFETVPSTWAELRDRQHLTANPGDPTQEGSEAALASRVLKTGDYQASAAAGLQLLAVLDKRWCGNSHPVAKVFGPGTDLGSHFPNAVMGILAFLRSRDSVPLERTVAEIMQRFVIEQHLRIALRKLHQQGKRTFLFEMVNGMLERPVGTAPVLTNPRIATAISFLQDLYLIAEDGPTSRGKKVLQLI